MNDTFINGVQIDFGAGNPSSTALTENDLFFFGFPTSGAPGTVLHTDPPFTGDIFEIDVDPAAPFGVYTGTITLLGDSELPASCCDPTLQNPLTSAIPFQIDVTPEPSTWSLMLTGLAIIAMIARKRLNPA